MTEQANRRLLTTSDIAALANVDASTVSNWRRRFDGTFPTPVLTDDQGKRPKFDRDEIIEWLRQNPQVGGQRAVEPTRSSLVNLLGALERGVRENRDRSRDFDFLLSYLSPEWRVEVVGALLVGIELERRAGTLKPKKTALEIRQMIRDEEELHGPNSERDAHTRLPDGTLVMLYDLLVIVEQPLSTYDLLLFQRHNRLSDASEQTTPPALAGFLTSLLEPSPEGVAFDPVAGYGSLMMYCIQEGKAKTAVGVEVNKSAARVANRRFILANVDAQIVLGDSLDGNAPWQGTADSVVADPPLGIAMRPQRERAVPIDWEFGTPKASNADTAWLQLAVSHLKPGGRAIVVTTTGTLFQPDKATAQIRNEMVRRGAVQAVFTLPGRLRVNTNIRLAVWVLTTPDAPDRRNDVLLVDLGADDASAIAPDGLGVQAFKSWMSDPGTTLDSTFAVAVPVTDLLAPDATLLPSKWTTIKEDGIDGETWKRRVDTCNEAANASLGSQQQLPKISVQPRAEAPGRITVGELMNQGAVTIIRGRHMERHHGDEESLAILTVKDARSMQPDSAAAEERVASDPASVAQLVQPGDVLVYPDKDSVVARVWNDTGWVIGRFMQVIRIVDNAWDAHYLAAAINNPTNARHLREGVARTHFTLTEFEIVMLDREAQKVAAQIDRQYEELTAQLAKASDAVALARTETLTALSSGTVVVEVK